MEVEFDTHWYIGVGRDNTLIFGKDNPDGKSLVLCQFSANKYRILWDKQCPTGVDSSHVKLIYSQIDSCDRKIVVRSLTGTDPTCLYGDNDSLVEEHRQNVGLRCKLLDILHDGRICYAKSDQKISGKRGSGQKQTTIVDIYSDITASEGSLQLWPPEGEIIGDGLSLSCCAETGWFALTEWDYRTLDIYRENGNIIQHIIKKILLIYSDLGPRIFIV